MPVQGSAPRGHKYVLLFRTYVGTRDVPLALVWCGMRDGNQIWIRIRDERHEAGCLRTGQVRIGGLDRCGAERSK